MNSQQYASNPQNYSRNARYAQSRESASPLRNMQIEYAKALDQIEDLKHEKDSLRNALDEALTLKGGTFLQNPKSPPVLRDKSDQDYREHSLFVERASQNLQESYTHKLYVQSEHRVLALEEENRQLKKQLDSHAPIVAQLQNDLRASQNKIQELDHIEAYNKHLQAEVQYLDQEFQNITKKVEWLDEDKAKTQITKSVSTKYSQNYNQTLLKYINHLVKVIESLDSKSAIRGRFNELFSKNSSIFKLVGNSDYTSLLLKSFKFIADLMPYIAPNIPLADFSLVNTTQDISPNRSRNVSASNFNVKGSLGDISPITIPNPVLQARSPTASNRNVKPHGSTTPTPTKSKSPALTERAKQQPAQGKRNMSQQMKPNDSASFGRRDNTPRDSQSFSTAVAVQSQTQRTPRNVQASPQATWETTPKERNINAPREYRSNPQTFHSSEYERQNTAELELIQRDRELLEKERQLIERKRLLMQRARELEEEEEMIRGQQPNIVEKERKSTSDFPVNVDHNNSIQKSRRGELQSARSFNPDNVEHNSRRAQDEPQSTRSFKPILNNDMDHQNDSIQKSRRAVPREESIQSFNPVNVEHKSRRVQPREDELQSARSFNPSNVEHNSRRVQDEPQSTRSLKPILKSQTSQAFADVNRDESILNNSSASIKVKSAKDISAALREKSKHLAQVLTRMGSYENNQPEQQERTFRSSNEEPKKVKLQSLQSSHSPVHSLPVYQPRKEYENPNYEDEQYEEEPEENHYDDDDEVYDLRHSEDNNNISYRSNVNPHSVSVSPFDTGRGGPKDMRRDDMLHKRVSFDERQVTEGFEDDGEEEAPQEYMYHGAYPESGEDLSMRRSRSPSRAEPPRGKQFSTFTVAFGRTESIERRSTSPPMRDVAGILDTPSKKRVNHTSQTYNVVTGDDVRTVASPDSQRLHYKMAYESAPYNRSNPKQAIKKNVSLVKSNTKSSIGSISSKLSL